MKKFGLLIIFLLTITILQAQTVSVDLRPIQIDISTTTSQSAVLITVSNYPSDSSRYRLYNSSNQYNCWNSEINSFVTSTAYASGPLVPGTPSTSSTWWIIFQRGNNNNTIASYRDRLAPYSSNYQTMALPSATAITSPFYLTGSVLEGGGYTLEQKYVVFGYDEVVSGNLICASYRSHNR